MQPVTILTTQNDGQGFEPFVHGETVFTFEPLTAAGPRKPIEGEGWAFVDWIMPELSGLEMCRRLRVDTRTAKIHITLVLDRDDVDDRRRALQAGADDYMVGPATRQAILDRILAVHSNRRSRAQSDLIQFGELQLDHGAMLAVCKGRAIPLSDKGFRLLRYLIENPNRLIRREEIMEAIGTSGDPHYIRTVDVWIKRLRTSLKRGGSGDFLRTVKGKGYVVDEPRSLR